MGNRRDQSFNKRRNLDDESGMSRTRGAKKNFPTPKEPESSDSNDEGDFTDSSVESFLNKHQKDDSRRAKPKPKPKNKRDKNVRPTDAQEEADDEDVESIKPEKPAETSSHMEMLLALTYRLGFVKKDYPHKSEYIPDTGNMFHTLNQMLITASQNSLLHEVFPAFSSIAIQAYYSHAVFYHILRIRDDAGRLGRIERRALRAYEQIGAPESWPVATPLIGYFQGLGSIIPEGGKYGQIVPALPELDKLTKDKGLQGLSATHGIGRLPIVPALVQYLYNYAHQRGHFDDTDGLYYPLTQKALANTAGNMFVGLQDSAATAGDFQALAFSSSWHHATESEVDTFMMNNLQKQMLIRRWGIHPYADTDNLQSLDDYLGLTDAKNPSWMTNLLKCATAFNSFFPGSVNLNTIPLNTRVETVSKVNVTLRPGSTAEAGVANRWWTTRNKWQISLEGKVIREDAQRAYQAASALMMRPSYAREVKPAIVGHSMTDRTFTTEDGYFYHASEPATEMENAAQDDPMILVSQIIDSKMYDRFGGRKN